MLNDDSVGCETCMSCKPVEPLPGDCCGSGCNPCVLDLYEADLAAWRIMCDKCHAGGTSADHEESSNQQFTDQQNALSINEYRSLKLHTIKKMTSDTSIYTFLLPKSSQLGLGIGQHLILRAPVNDRLITRQYTPISLTNSGNQLDVLIKVYEDGIMSKYIKKLKEGDKVEWRGPFGTFSYQPNQFHRIVMLAAGTGITPMLQVIRHILSKDDDETFIRLLYASRTYRDILMRETLNEMTDYWNFTVLYVLSQETQGTHASSYRETFHYGRINQGLLAAELEAGPQQSTQFLICGTKSFEKDMFNFLNKLHFNGKIFKF